MACPDIRDRAREDPRDTWEPRAREFREREPGATDPTVDRANAADAEKLTAPSETSARSLERGAVEVTVPAGRHDVRLV